MSITKRERARREFIAALEARGLIVRGETHETVSKLLGCSVDALKAWMKPETSASSNPIPHWVMPMLEAKAPLARRRA